MSDDPDRLLKLLESLPDVNTVSGVRRTVRRLRGLKPSAELLTAIEDLNAAQARVTEAQHVEMVVNLGLRKTMGEMTGTISSDAGGAARYEWAKARTKADRLAAPWWDVYYDLKLDRFSIR